VNILPVGAELLQVDGQTDRQTNMAKIKVAFCNFANEPKNSTFCPHTEFMCSVWISEQTAIISLHNIN